MQIENYISPRLLDAVGGSADMMLMKTASMVEGFLRSPRVDRELYRRQLEFYFEKGYVANPASFFSFPKKPPVFHVESEEDYHGGKRTIYTYPSEYQVRNPELESYYQRFPNNRTGYLIHLNHGDDGRDTVICLHGFGLGPPRQARRMFRMRRLFEAGLDVALFITPFHWRRAPHPRLSGRYYLVPHNAAVTCENIGRTMYELVGCFQMLKARGAGRIGVIGASLGGYHSAVFASVTDLPEFVVLVVPGVDFLEYMKRRQYGLNPPGDPDLIDKIEKVWRIHSPFTHTLKIPKERAMIIAARGDAMCPFPHIQRLNEHWGNPPHHFLTGGHWIFFDRKSRGRAWYGFLKDVGFL